MFFSCSAKLHWAVKPVAMLLLVSSNGRIFEQQESLFLPKFSFASYLPQVSHIKNRTFAVFALNFVTRSKESYIVSYLLGYAIKCLF